MKSGRPSPRSRAGECGFRPISHLLNLNCTLFSLNLPCFGADFGCTFGSTPTAEQHTASMGVFKNMHVKFFGAEGIDVPPLSFSGKEFRYDQRLLMIMDSIDL